VSQSAVHTVKSVNTRLAEELGVAEGQVAAAVALLDEGATVPFIARYRKEVTGSLDDGQLRTLEERLQYLRELDQRRAAVLASIEEQGKLTEELKAALLAADTKARIEDIYLPYKPKRRTKAQIAREAGLEPLADRLLAEGGLVEKLTARNGPLEQLADVADTLNRLAPGLEALAPTIETLREAVTTLSLVVNPLSTIADRIPIPGRRRYTPPQPVTSERVRSDRLVHDEDE
jgi:uncharacterized protein